MTFYCESTRSVPSWSTPSGGAVNPNLRLIDDFKSREGRLRVARHFSIGFKSGASPVGTTERRLRRRPRVIRPSGTNEASDRIPGHKSPDYFRSSLGVPLSKTTNVLAEAQPGHIPRIPGQNRPYESPNNNSCLCRSKFYMHKHPPRFLWALDTFRAGS